MIGLLTIVSMYAKPANTTKDIINGTYTIGLDHPEFSLSVNENTSKIKPANAENEPAISTFFLFFGSLCSLGNEKKAATPIKAKKGANIQKNTLQYIKSVTKPLKTRPIVNPIAPKL